MTDMRHPDEIMADFAAGCAGREDIDMMDVLHEVIADVLDSAILAIKSEWEYRGMPGSPDGFASVVAMTVSDYIVNNYGED